MNTTLKTNTKPVPIKTVEDIAKAYGYDQIIILGRTIGKNGKEHLTTYGINKEQCSAAAFIGHFLKRKVMKWKGN